MELTRQIADPASALRMLTDRSAIADLVHGYALHIRDGKGRACAELFAPDAVFEMFDLDVTHGLRRLRARHEGRDAIIDHIAAASSDGARVCPMIHNLTIAVEGDEAEGACSMTGIVIPGGHAFVGEYRDRFRWDGVWRFSSRAHTILLDRPAPPV